MLGIYHEATFDELNREPVPLGLAEGPGNMDEVSDSDEDLELQMCLTVNHLKNDLDDKRNETKDRENLMAAVTGVVQSYQHRAVLLDLERSRMQLNDIRN